MTVIQGFDVILECCFENSVAISIKLVLSFFVENIFTIPMHETELLHHIIQIASAFANIKYSACFSTQIIFSFCAYSSNLVKVVYAL